MDTKRDERFIVFEGAPASGKTSTLNALKGRLNEKTGTRVIFIPETAAHMLRDMPDPVREVNTDFLQQYYIFRSQTLLEETAASAPPDDSKRTLYIADRGRADVYLYTPAGAAVIAGCTLSDLLERYDAVLFFQSGSEENFREALVNDPDTPRSETYEEALALDEAGEEVWSRHKSFFRIPYMDTPEEKIEAVIRLINRIAQDEVFV